MSQRVYLHIGVHRSGTSHLQSKLLRHRAALRDQGVLYPGSENRMFLAAVDVRGAWAAWGLRRRDVRGSWDELCRRARRHPGATVVSHELFAAAATRQVSAALTMLRGLDVHVVVTSPGAAHPATLEALARWGRAVPPENLHLLYASPGPAGDEMLWRQLAGVVGFDPVPTRLAEGATTD